MKGPNGSTQSCPVSKDAANSPSPPLHLPTSISPPRASLTMTTNLLHANLRNHTFLKNFVSTLPPSYFLFLFEHLLDPIRKALAKITSQIIPHTKRCAPAPHLSCLTPEYPQPT